jgi:hypothetical protein
MVEHRTSRLCHRGYRDVVRLRRIGFHLSVGGLRTDFGIVLFGSADFSENLGSGPYRTPGLAVLSSILLNSSRVCMSLSRSRD